MPTHYVYLILAILFEVVGTSAINVSNGFSKLVPSAIGIVCFFAALFFMSLVLKVMPVGIVYAIWAGLGIVTITLIGFVVFGQKLDMPALFGIGLIVAGVLVINLFSSSTTH